MTQTPMSISQALQYAKRLRDEQKFQQAMAIYQQIIQAAPHNISASLELARLLVQFNQLAQARQVLSARSSYAQNNFEYLYMLSALSLKLNKLNSAEIHAERALALQPESYQALNLLGSIHLESNRFDAAIEQFKQSLKHQPEFVDAHNNLAWSYRAVGQKNDAIAHFREAYRLDSSASEALSGLLMLQTNTDKNEDMREAKRQLQNPVLKHESKAELHFALGKAFEDSSDFTSAAEQFKSGNRLWRQSIQYDIKQDIALFQQIKETVYSPIDLSESHHVDSAEDSGAPAIPIFVLGLPRSSTSLVEQILASHSQVTGAGELTFLSELCLQDGQFSFSDQSKYELRAKYLKRIAALGVKTPYVVDKMPQNFRLIGVIRACFPEAKIIHCHRDARDNCLSLYKHHFPMTSHQYAYSFDEIKQYYRLYQDLMKHWESSFEHSHFNSDYEQLIHNLEEGVEALLDYCGLDFEAGCLEFHKTDRAIRTASSDQVRRGLYQSGSGQWQHYQETLGALFEDLE